MLCQEHAKSSDSPAVKQKSRRVYNHGIVDRFCPCAYHLCAERVGFDIVFNSIMRNLFRKMKIAWTTVPPSGDYIHSQTQDQALQICRMSGDMGETSNP